MLAILIALVVIARRLRLGSYDYRVVNAINESMENLAQASGHYAEVGAILALTEQFESRPDLAARLSEFSAQTVATALMVRINGVAAAIKAVQALYTEQSARRSKGLTNSAERCEKELATLNKQLLALHELNRQFGKPTLTSVN